MSNKKILQNRSLCTLNIQTKSLFLGQQANRAMLLFDLERLVLAAAKQKNTVSIYFYLYIYDDDDRGNFFKP